MPEQPIPAAAGRGVNPSLPGWVHRPEPPAGARPGASPASPRGRPQSPLGTSAGAGPAAVTKRAVFYIFSSVVGELRVSARDLGTGAQRDQNRARGERRMGKRPVGDGIGHRCAGAVPRSRSRGTG